MRIRKGERGDLERILAIVNEAAQAYRGVIPADRWREPYMPNDELEKELAHGVVFWVAEEQGRLLVEIETSVVLADKRWTAGSRGNL